MMQILWIKVIIIIQGLHIYYPITGYYINKLLDLSGRLFYQRKEHLKSGNNQLEISSDGWSSGAYILEIKGANIEIREKIIKK